MLRNNAKKAVIKLKFYNSLFSGDIMKINFKFITPPHWLVACILALTLAFAFTSCSDGSSGGSDDDSGQVTATVPKIYATAENITDKITNLSSGTHTLIVTGDVNGILTRNGGNFSEVAAALIELKKNCSDAKVILDLSGTENLTEIPKHAFEGNTSYFTDNLVGVVLPNTVISIGSDSFGNTGITEISIPASVKSIEDYAFGRCRNLASVKLPNGLTSIGGLAFRYCYSLKSIVIPDSVTTLVCGTFEDCSSLTDVVLGSGVTEIQETVFCGWSSLETIYIPVSVTKIGAGAFQCALDAAEKSFTVKYAGSVEQWNNIDVNMNASSVMISGMTNASLLKATIVCTDGKGTYEELKNIGQ